jgi:hypothetical protein
VDEFGQSFVNPYTMQPAISELINNYKDLFKPIPHQGQYTDWLTVFNELTVQAELMLVGLFIKALL